MNDNKVNSDVQDRVSEEISKASLKRMKNLISLLDKLSSEKDAEAALLAKFQELYRDIPQQEKPHLFEMLMSHVSIHKQDIEEDIRLLLEADEKDPIRWNSILNKARQMLESQRKEAFRGFINITGGLQFLLDLRADVLAAQRQIPENLVPLDEDIAHLFNSWFQEGFLFLQEITQDSPYRQICFLRDHDMVHPMASLEQMGHRLGEDRRCFALFHRTMPEEPVIFIEVALTRGIVGSMHDIIRDIDAPQILKGTPDTAIFYSINNTQNGLSGIGLGKMLIFQVVDAIERDHPAIKTFATLSPIPGFWDLYLKLILEMETTSFALKRDQLERCFPEKVRESLMDRQEELTGSRAPELPTCLKLILSDPQWIEDPVYPQLLKSPLTKLTHFYITKEKNIQGRPLNPVANFHIGNGATVGLKNINFAANRTQRGLEESCGMMVNYMYSKTWLQQFALDVKSKLGWKGS